MALKANHSSDEQRGQVLMTPEIGQRLRSARNERALGVRELSRLVGVSGSTISQIELGNVMPSVATLYRLVSTLQISMDDLFAVTPSRAGNSGVTDQAGPLTSAGPVQRRDGRPSLRLASGVHWERLSNVADPNVEFIWSRYEAGGESCAADALVRHGGKEFGYVESGRLGVTIGFNTYELAAGDSISFDSTEPHRLFALGDDPAEVVWVVIDRRGDGRGFPQA
jgi:transcriptional regulator with XRE-family HTH domain